LVARTALFLCLCHLRIRPAHREHGSVPLPRPVSHSL
jgi:hypothetical protein